MGAYKADYVKIELTGSSLHRSFCHRPLGAGDIEGDRFGVEVFRNGDEYALTLATCVGYFMRADGDTVAITGQIDGNDAYVDLPQACYAVEGKFTLVIKVIMDSQTSTLRIVDGTVVKTTTESQIDPGTEIPDLAELLAKIEDMEDATSAAIAAYSTYAAAYDDGTAYSIGQYVCYNNKLWRCTTEIPDPGEEWTADHWYQVVLCDDLTALRWAVGNSVRPVLFPDSLVTSDMVIEGKYIRGATDGTEVSRAGYMCTDFIPVEGYELYTSNCGRNYAWYTSGKAYISGSGGSIKNASLRAPGNAAYFRFTCNKLTDVAFPELINFRKKSSRTEGVKGLKNDSLIVGTQFPMNKIDVNDWTDGAYISTSSGRLSEDSGYFATGYITVTPGFTYRANHGRNWAWYDSEKAFLSGETGTGIQTSITAPDNAAYIRFTVNKTSDGISNPALLYFAVIDYYNAQTIIPGLDAAAASWYVGKTVNWIGDSIVAGQDFDEEVISALGMVQAGDYGINGSTIALDTNGGDSRSAVVGRYGTMDDADVIAVSAGTNDFEYAWCPIGDIDSTTNNTFYGALKNLCSGLITKYPDKIIFFTTPIKRSQAFANGAGGSYTADGVTLTPWSKNKYGKTLGDYADIIKEVCGYYSIPVLDLYRESLLNPHIAAQQGYFDSDLTHPTTTGQKIMARRVCGWLRGLGYTISGL